MTPDILYLPLMGMFCTGYALHLCWRMWSRRRQTRKSMVHLELMQIRINNQPITWADWDVQDVASDVRRAA